MDDTLNQQSSITANDKIAWPLVGVLLGLGCIVTIDHSVATFFSDTNLPGDLNDFLDAVEHFGTPYGQFLGLLCVAAVEGWREPRVLRIFAGTSVAGLAANLLKLCIGRTRPHAFEFETGQRLEEFVSWFPLHSGGSTIESFPSAHTASAFGFAALLTWAYPRGRAVFVILAFLVGFQRVATSAHFPSDILVGAAVGWSVGLLFTGSTSLGRFFDKVELHSTLESEI